MKKIISQQEIDDLSLTERMHSSTPKFFRKIKIIGISLAAASAAILTAPISLPALVVTIAGYLAVAGTVATAVSQAAVQAEAED